MKQCHTVSYDDIFVEGFVPVDVGSYVLGTEANLKESFYVTVPRKYKKLYITGINQFGRDTWLDLAPYDDYVKARAGRKGLNDIEKPKIYISYPTLANNFYRTEELFITIEGTVSDNMGLLSFTVNNNKVKVNDIGYFIKLLKVIFG